MIKSQRMKWVGHIARVEEMKNAYKILVETPEEKRALGRPGRRWEVNLRIDLKEIFWKVVDWICLAQDRDRLRAVVNTVMNHQIP
jgi:hypothetical protein